MTALNDAERTRLGNPQERTALDRANQAALDVSRRTTGSGPTWLPSRRFVAAVVAILALAVLTGLAHAARGRPGQGLALGALLLVFAVSPLGRLSDVDPGSFLGRDGVVVGLLVLELLLAHARTRNSTLWADDPRQQLAYLAIKRWARLYCPDVILGVYSPDELNERGPAEKDITPPKRPRPADVASAAQAETVVDVDPAPIIADLEAVAQGEGEEAFKAAWLALGDDDKHAVGIAERDRILAKAREAGAE